MLIEVDIHQLEEKFSKMTPEFARGAVYVRNDGYWPAARLTPLLRKAGRDDLLVTESPAADAPRACSVYAQWVPRRY
ncbi:MAG: hypothetical protein ACXWCY_22895 [Burkholderiales bacterium]